MSRSQPNLLKDVESMHVDPATAIRREDLVGENVGSLDDDFEGEFPTEAILMATDQLHKNVDVSMNKKALSEYNEGYSNPPGNNNPNGETLLDDLSRPVDPESVDVALEG